MAVYGDHPCEEKIAYRALNNTLFYYLKPPNRNLRFGGNIVTELFIQKGVYM